MTHGPVACVASFAGSAFSAADVLGSGADCDGGVVVRKGAGVARDAQGFTGIVRATGTALLSYVEFCVRHCSDDVYSF